MEKRDAMFVLLVLGGAGYATYANWGVIAEKMGFTELDPSRLKAIDLAKKSVDMRRGISNWQHLQSLDQLGKIQVYGDPWQADPMTGSYYRVTVHWTEDGEEVTHWFKVDIAASSVAYQGATDQPAAPR